MQKHVLIVDDSLTSRAVVKSILTKNFNCKVSESTNALDGLDALDSMQSTDSVDLIITDYNMPNMNGMEFISDVRDHYGYRIPIIMFTSFKTAEEEAVIKGADDVISKPFEERDLLEVVGQYLR